MNTAFICIVSEEYLPYYKVLYNSLKKHAPECDQILYFIGKNIPIEFDETVVINELYDKCSNNYNRLERICSLRALVVLDAFEKGYSKVVFTGAKVKFFQAPWELINFDSNAVVTPHILKPLPEDGKFPSNASVSFTGHISTDVVAFRNCPEIREFLIWQDEIMKTKCKTTNHTYLDQSWLNFLPFFVDNVTILRDSRYNVAYWNAIQRSFEKRRAKYYVEGQKMVCFQYSGLDLNNPEKISTHQNREIATGDYLEFLKDYIKELKC